MTRLNANSIRRATLALIFCGLISSLALPFTGASHAARSRDVGSTGWHEQKAVAVPAAPTSLTPEQAQAAYGKVGMTFERNQGQTNEAVSFLAHGAGYTLFLTPAESVFVLRNSDCGLRNENGVHSLSELDRRHSGNNQQSAISNQQSTVCNPQSNVLRMKLEGANSQPAISGLDELEGKVSYFIGSEPENWHTNIPTFGRVQYRGVYEGVDMVYYGNQQQLEYDFVVQPGADYQQIALAFEGANNVEVEGASGDLLLRVGETTLRQHKPVVYQDVNGARKQVESGYELKSAGRIGIAVGAYDSQKPLIIDPVLAYSTYLGGSSLDIGNSIAVDSAGNAYVTGVTVSTNFPTANAIQPTRNTNFDAFITKFNVAGTARLYSTYLGGNGDDSGNGIALDSAGNAYMTGGTNSTNFPTNNAIQNTKSTGPDAFVTKLNASGTALVYSTYLGANNVDNGLGIAIDTAGNAYITGGTFSTNFPTTAGAFDTADNPGLDAFVTKINALGTAHLYSTYLGGGGDEQGNGIAVDSVGNASVTGSTVSTDFPTAQPIQPTNGGGNNDAFVTKFDASGSGLVYSTYLGGTQNDRGNAIAVDSSGNAYVTGITSSSNFPSTHPPQPTYGGVSDAFVTKVSGSSGALIYSTFLGGNEEDNGKGITVDSDSNVYVTGSTVSIDFPTFNAIQSATNGSFDDVFVTKLDSAGPVIAYSTYLGGAQGDNGNAIAIDSFGNAYITGFTDSSDFPTANAIQGAGGGGPGLSDAFIFKIGSFVIAGRVTDASSNGLASVTVTLSGASAANTTTDAAGNFAFVNTIPGGNYTVTPTASGFSFNPSSVQIDNLNRNQDILFIGTSAATPTPTPTATPAIVQFSAASFGVGEGNGSIQIIATRSGDTSQPLSVNYGTTDGTATDRGDYTTALGTLHFAAGDTAESFNVFITDDVFAEGNETINLTLSNPSSGAEIGGSATAVLTIVDNDLVNGTTNPIDATDFFVRQHYRDFLNREPDAAGLAFWTNNIESCGANAQCRVEKRVDTSAAFFLSIEFQQTGFLVERVYQAAFNRFPSYREFISDTQELGHDVVVGEGSWQAQLDANKQQFAADFAARPDFLAVYGGLSNEQYVDALNANTGGSLSAADRNALVAGLNGATETRASVLRKVSENAAFTQHELNRAFVLMQYFGYLRRNPNDAPDSDFSGYNFWLTKLNSFNGDFRKADMVKAFITSTEYRKRFGQP
jgi:hypothetical protein